MTSLGFIRSGTNEQVNSIRGETFTGGRFIGALDPGSTVMQHETITGGGTISTTIPLSLLSPTGASQVFTLGNATRIGQLKILTRVGTVFQTITVNLSLLNLLGTSSAGVITMDDISDTVLLVWTGIAWTIMESITSKASV